ncbi:serine hydrolase FSH [Aspergillus germanicus]
MRILCLPGYGTNPDIMKRQLSLLLKICDPSWEFDFLQAKVPCRPAPGPFLCWTEDFGPTENRAALDLIHYTFATEGPFDGVFGFSQGASMVAAYLLEQASLHPDRNLPVNSGYSTRRRQFLRRTRVISNEVVHLPEPARTSVTLLAETLTIMKPVHGRSLSYLFDRPATEIPCVLLPDVYAVRLGIPTLHVLARDDPAPLQRSSEVCRGFCDPTQRRVFRHSAVHGLPRESGESGEVREFVEFIRELSEEARESRL